MKHIALLFCLFFPILLFSQQNTTKSTEQKKFEPINLWFVMLMKGTNRTQDSTAAAKLQEGHMANINKMAASGKLLVAGPFLEDANWRGVFILKCDTKEEAENLVKDDPAVKAGRLSYEIHPWMTGKNCLFN